MALAIEDTGFYWGTNTASINATVTTPSNKGNLKLVVLANYYRVDIVTPTITAAYSDRSFINALFGYSQFEPDPDQVWAAQAILYLDAPPPGRDCTVTVSHAGSASNYFNMFLFCLSDAKQGALDDTDWVYTSTSHASISRTLTAVESVSLSVTNFVGFPGAESLAPIGADGLTRDDYFFSSGYPAFAFGHEALSSSGNDTITWDYDTGENYDRGRMAAANIGQSVYTGRPNLAIRPNCG